MALKVRDSNLKVSEVESKINQIEVDNLNKCKNHHNEKKNVEPTLLRFYIFQLTTPSTLTARLSVPEAEKQP